MFKFLKILILSFPKIISTAFRDQEDEHRAEECFSCVSSFVVAQLLHVLGATCGGTCAASPVQDNGQSRSCQIDLKTEKLLVLLKPYCGCDFKYKVKLCSVAAHTGCLGQLSICKRTVDLLLVLHKTPHSSIFWSI